MMARIAIIFFETLSVLGVVAITLVGLVAGFERGGAWIVAAPALAFAIASALAGLFFVARRFTPAVGPASPRG